MCIRDRVCTDDSVARSVDQNLGGGSRLTDPVVGVPATGVAVANIDVDALVPGLLFEHPHPGELGNREHRGRDTGVVGDDRGALQHVGRGDLAFQDRDRGQGHPRSVGRVAGGVDRWVRGALQVTSDAYAVLVPVDPGSVEVQTLQLRCSAGAVNDEVELHGLGFPGSFDTDLVTGRGLLDGLDSGGALKPDPRGCASGDQELDEVGVERLQWAQSTVDDDRGAAGTSRDVGELEGDEATTNEQDPRREHPEVQEVGAVDQVLVAGKVQRSWTCTGGDCLLYTSPS